MEATTVRTNVASRPAVTGLAQLPAIAAAGVLWSYIASIWVYKTWYIAAAAAMIVVVILVASGAVRTRGLIAGLLPVLLYFGSLLTGALWASYPQDTIQWVAIDSIEIFVFILFFVAYRNATPRLMAACLMSVVIPTIVIAAVMYRNDPTVSRLANYALALMPIAVSFGAAHLAMTRRRWPAAVTFAIAFAILLAARSRTPIIAAIVAAGLSIIVYSRNKWLVIVRAFWGLLGIVAIITTLTLIPRTRPMIVATFVRFTRIAVTWGDIYIVPEDPDLIRIHISELARKLGREHFPLGLGYMNFEREYERMYAMPANLHNTFSTWWVEGGIACLLAVLILVVCHLVDLRRAFKASGDEHIFAKACLISTIAVALMGLFHQIHQTPAMWLVLGLGSAAGHRKR